jgi:hypothetical protein
LEFNFDNGTRVNWNTTLSVGANWRADDPDRRLYSRADGSLIGLWSGTPMRNIDPVPAGDGIAGQQAAGDGNLNWAKGDRFATPFKVITDVEVKKGKFGVLVRAKAWYDQALNDEEVRVGNQVNDFNGARPGLFTPGQPAYLPCTVSAPPCLPISPPGNNEWPKAKLSDEGFEDEQKFDNVYLLDAYVYGSFPIGDSDLQLRLGNQVINWGESVFIQGVNQINPIDVPAARRAGAELKEILLPIWAAYMNWGFGFGSLEAFYQFKWNNTSVDGCGQYFTVSGTQISTNPGQCRSITVFGAQNGGVVGGVYQPHLGSQPYLQRGLGAYIPAVNGREPSDSGQFGLAFRVPVSKIDTEFGFYAMNIHSRLPLTSSRSGTNWTLDLSAADQARLRATGTPFPAVGEDEYGSYWDLAGTRFRTLLPLVEGLYERKLQALGSDTDLHTGEGFWEYPEDIQIYGISSASNVGGWSVSSELSYHVDVPVQVNGNDLVAAGVLGIGPYRAQARVVANMPEGSYLQGWDRFNKTQFQVNTVKTLSNILGAENLLLIGEVGAQWNNVPEYKNGGIRYGRGFMYGTGSTPDLGPGGSVHGQPDLPGVLLGNTCTPTYAGVPQAPVSNGLYNAQPEGCHNDGYVSDFAWGYRVRANLDYNNVLNSGVTVSPSVYWAHDVEGFSMDPAFIEDRQVLGLGLKFTLNKQYVLDLNYVQYANDNFDPTFDRDYYSASMSVTF